MGKGTWTALGKEKVASSGMTTKQAEALGIYEVPSAAQLHKSYETLPALIIPYTGTDGKPLTGHPKFPNFYRVRYLAKGKSFKDLATDKSQRYAQEPGTGSCAYFPNSRPWLNIVKDTREPIIFTEGEFKAAAGCAQAFNVVGLGGVWNFKAMKEGVLFLPELSAIDWVKRRVYICYDSDYIEKPQVCYAINGLAEELEERGALVRVILLPEGEKGKQGLDDFLLENTKEDFQELIDGAERIGISRALWDINREVVYVNDPGMVVVADTGQKLEVGKFKEHSKWAAMSAVEARMGEKGEIAHKKVSAAPIWIKWPLRRFVNRISYAPGKPQITEENEYNAWKSWGVRPKKGNIDPWLQLTKFIFADLDKDMLEWFFDWCAYPIQNPGVKMYTSVIVHGLEQGTGKSFIGYTLGRIYGDNFQEVTSDHIEDGQTWWAENKQFIMGDEITGKDNRQHHSMLKRLITQEKMTINIKFIPQYTIKDCINYYFTAQHGDAFFLEDKDRRYFVNEVTSPPLPERFYKQYEHWLDEMDGASHLFQWLLDRKISPKFNPRAPAPDTAAKRRMILSTKGELSRWVHDCIENPAQMLVSGQMRHTRDLFNSRELVSMYTNLFPDAKVTTVGMGRALAQAGCPQVDSGRTLRGPDGKQDRYFALRQREKWRKSTDRKKMESNIAMPPIKRTN